MPGKDKRDPVIVSISSLEGRDNLGYAHGDDVTRNNRYDVTDISTISGKRVNDASLTRRNGHGNGSGLDPALAEDCIQKADTGKKVGQQQQQQTVEMKRSINLLYMTAILIAVTGHSSIFVSPSDIFAQTGSVGGALLAWLVGGLINLGQALCFAELGTMFSQAGGPYAYATKAFGPLMGFLMMWGYTVLIAGPFWAFLANTAALYIVRPVFPDCMEGDVPLAVKLLAGWIMVTMVVLNCVYMKYVTKVQTLLSASKMVALLIIIGGGVYNLATGETELLESPFASTHTDPGQLALAVFYSVFSYGGWQVMTTMLEEVKNPARDPPRAVYISFTVVIIKYILTNVAYFTLLTPSDITGSSAVASLFTSRMFPQLVIPISVLVALTSIGALNASIMGHSRLLYAGARNGHMPQLLGMLHAKYLTPWPSIFVYLAWGMVMLFTGGVQDFIEFISLFSTIMGLTCISALLYLRWSQPDVHRPYRTMTFIPVLELVVNIVLLALVIYKKPHKMGVGIGILAAGIPIYWFGVLWRDKPKEFNSIVDDLTMFAQKVLLVTKVKK